MTDGSGTGVPFRRVHGAEGAAPRTSAPPPGGRAGLPPAPPAGGRPAPQPSQPRYTEAQRAADGAEAGRLQAEMASRAATVRARLDAIAQAVESQRAQAEHRQREELAARRKQADQTRDERLAGIEEEFRELAEQVSLTAGETALSLAPGPASQDWDEAEPAAGQDPPPQFTRFGHIDTASGATWAALAPLAGHAGWLIEGPRDQTGSLMRSAILRIAATTPIKHLRIVGFDPRIDGSLGLFAPLRGANAATFPIPATDPQAFKKALAGVVASAARNAEELGNRGLSSLHELWQANGMPTGEFTLLAILDYPNGLDDDALALLTRLAQTGGPRGVTLLVQAAESKLKAKGKLARHLTRFSYVDGTWINEVLPAAIPVSADEPIAQADADRILAAIAGSASLAQGPVEPLLPLIAEDAGKPWGHDSIGGLRMRIGVKGRAPLDLELRSENPPLPNMLVGGAVGQGKSNLVLDIIYSLATRYSPDELELLLLDFKRGLEFKRFDADDDGKNWLPHVSVLSLESNKDFGLAVLHHVAAELERRSKEFKAAGANSIGEYRAKSAKPLARQLLIIDEFHVLFDGDDDRVDQATEILELLARQGRAFGIHLLLASQTISGISGLRAKGDSIFAQFPLRASLKNTAMESQAILSQHNTAAAELTYRGEIIINRNFGLDPAGSNERALAAYADPADMAELQSRLWELRPDSRPPMVFLGEDFARFDARQIRELDRVGAQAPGELIHLWPGRPISVTDEPADVVLERDVDQAIAVIGPKQELVAASLGALLATAALSLGDDAGLVILDGTSGPATETPGWLEAALEIYRDRGIAVRTVPRHEIALYLAAELRSELKDASPAAPARLILGLGLQRVADMTRDVPEDPGADFPSYFTPADVLRELTTRGATSGHFFIGAWTTLRTVTEQLGHSHDGIGTYLLAGLGNEDVRDLLGPGFHLDGYPRIVLADRRSDAGTSALVPFTQLEAGHVEDWSRP